MTGKRIIKVYHDKQPIFNKDKRPKWNEENYEKVAEFSLPLKGTSIQCAEMALILTNGVEMSWFENTKLNWIAEGTRRPTSVGDIIVVDDVPHKCESFTWSVIKQKK